MLMINSGRQPVPFSICQSGIALFSGLIFLLVLTILGVSMFGNVTVQEKMAGNFRTKIRTYQAADSSIRDVWTVADLLGNADDNDVATETRVSQMGDLFDTETFTLDASSTICYGGEIPMPLSTEMNADVSEGGHVPLAHHLFGATGDANIVATHARSSIRQTGYVTRPTTGRPASVCPS